MSTEMSSPPLALPTPPPESPSRPVGSPTSLGSTPKSQKNMRDRVLVNYQGDKKEVVLPELKNSSNSINKNKPLPTSLQSDFIPDDVMLALTAPPPPGEQLGPPTRYRNLNTTSGPVRKPPAAVWNHPKRRERFKHLTDNTVCVCGAGRDISFLYDVPTKTEKLSKPSAFDDSVARLEATKEGKQKPPLQLPDTLIPDEYHIVKNKGVMGLEYNDEKFATQPEDHEKHLVVFPSMNPTSRYEVVQLKKTLDEMMKKAGIDDDVNLEGASETQMHQLLELIKKEQDIYNIIFHEVIRQVTIECTERGELLSSVRNRYHELLNKVPKQVKSLHEEVMAQRALDRRLTEELMRFKNTISILTNELTEVKEHDETVTMAATSAQEDLKQALAESQKNASLLGEYHDLYELQRNRLELQVNMLTEEKELWSTAAYSLALKVTQEHNLQTAKRLHISEKAWQKLANHFTILLSDQDTGVLTRLQGHVDRWRDLTEVFNFNMKRRDEAMRDALRVIKREMESIRIDFEKNHIPKEKGREGILQKTPTKDEVAEYFNSIKNWEELISTETEKFGGDTMLTMQDELTKIKSEMYGWTDNALKVFNRHRGEDGSNYPDHDAMLKMNDSIEELLKQYQVRLTGENGVARGFIHLSNVLETWDTRFNTLLHGSNPLPDAEWTRFYQLIEDWINSVDETLTFIGMTQREEDRIERKKHREVEYIEAVKLTQRWVSSATNGVDSEDAKLVEQVSTLHTDMVKWMVQMLLRIAPDMKENSQEAKEMALLGSTSISELQTNAKALFEHLDSFTRYVSQCCNNIVKDAMQQKMDNHEENADQEYRELMRLKSESDEWINTAILLLHELTGEMIEFRPVSSSVKVAESRPKEPVYHDHEKLSVPDTSRSKQTFSEDGLGFSEYGMSDHSGMGPSPGGVSPRSGIAYSEPMSERSLPQPSEKSGVAPSENMLSVPSEQDGPSPIPEQESPAPVGGTEPAPVQEEGDGPPPPVPAEEAPTSPSPPSPVNPAPTTLSDVKEEVEDEDEEKSDADQEEPAPVDAPDEAAPPPSDDQEKVQMIGKDQNTHYLNLEQDPSSPPPKSDHQVADPSQPTPNTEEAYEALAAVETLQMQLVGAEERAQIAEGKCHKMEEELNKAMETIRALERKLAPSASSEQEPPKPASATSVTPSKSDKESVASKAGSSDSRAKKPDDDKHDGGSVKSDKTPHRRSDSQASVRSTTSRTSTRSKKSK